MTEMKKMKIVIFLEQELPLIMILENKFYPI